MTNSLKTSTHDDGCVRLSCVIRDQIGDHIPAHMTRGSEVTLDMIETCAKKMLDAVREKFTNDVEIQLSSIYQLMPNDASWFRFRMNITFTDKTHLARFKLTHPDVYRELQTWVKNSDELDRRIKKYVMSETINMGEYGYYECWANVYSFGM